MGFFDRISMFLFGGGVIKFKVTTVSGDVYNVKQHYTGVPEGDFIEEARRHVRSHIRSQLGEEIHSVTFVSHLRS